MGLGLLIMVFFCRPEATIITSAIILSKLMGLKMILGFTFILTVITIYYLILLLVVILPLRIPRQHLFYIVLIIISLAVSTLLISLLLLPSRRYIFLSQTKI